MLRKWSGDDKSCFLQVKSFEVSPRGLEFVLHGFGRKKVFDLNEIRFVRVKKVFSLYDELMFWVVGNEKYSFTDAVTGFQLFSTKANLEEKLGREWYARAERGEELEYRH